jgi:cytochrome d ubiquinol oxidase subunit I
VALGPVEQEYLLEARQMQALSFAVHIPLVCFVVGAIAVATSAHLSAVWLTGDAACATRSDLRRRSAGARS